MLHSNERPFGRVKGYFARYEFQSGSGQGNKPHVHIGLICDDDVPKETRPDNVDDRTWDSRCHDRQAKNRIMRQMRVSCHEGDLWNRTDFGSEGTYGLWEEIQIQISTWPQFILPGDEHFLPGISPEQCIERGWVASKQEYFEVVDLWDELHVRSIVFKHVHG